METSHLSALKTKHAKIDERINAESTRPAPDSSTLARLKKEKLKLKQAIAGA